MIFNSNTFDQLNKKEITVVVTDSGLGGLSVAASLLNNFKLYSSAKTVKIIFFNSLAHPDFGYNQMPNIERKAEVFDAALRSMESNYSPDIILIACNTLSVVFPFTNFSKHSLIPVVGIVEFGVNMIAQKLNEAKNSSAIILGTETTIKGNVHKKRLIEMGIEEDRIVTQACNNLESVIQVNPASKDTNLLIEKYIDEAVKSLNGLNRKINVALCCTHYEYSIPIFNEVLSTKGIDYSIINPNEKMSEFLFGDKKKKSGGVSKIEAKVVSRCKIADSDIENIGKCISHNSIEFESALKNYKLIQNLFEVDLPFKGEWKKG